MANRKLPDIIIWRGIKLKRQDPRFYKEIPYWTNKEETIILRRDRGYWKALGSLVKKDTYNYVRGKKDWTAQQTIDEVARIQVEKVYENLNKYGLLQDLFEMYDKSCTEEDKKIQKIIFEKTKNKKYVCNTCKDTHRMWLSSSEKYVMCTHCPSPCRMCKDSAPYCKSTPCNCNCHNK